MNTARINDLADAIAIAELYDAYNSVNIMHQPRQGDLTDTEFLTALTTAFDRNLPPYDRIVAYAKCGITDSIVGWTLRLWADQDSLQAMRRRHGFTSVAFWSEVQAVVKHKLDLDDTQVHDLIETGRASADPRRAVAMLRHLADTGAVDCTAYDRTITCGECRYSLNEDSPACRQCGHIGADNIRPMHYHCESCGSPTATLDGTCPKCNADRPQHNPITVQRA